MEKEENVYGEILSTEQGVDTKGDEARERTASEKEGLTVLGKFKDVDALARAYSCLQAEFTRRSQRLKELEKDVENFAKKEQNDKDDAGANVVEKLRKSSARGKIEEEKFDNFVSELEQANVCADGTTVLPAKPTQNKPENVSTVFDGAHFEEQSFKESLGKPISAVADTPVVDNRERGELSQEELYQRASRDENVRLKIIGEYLASLGKAGVPLTKGGMNAFTTPPMRAKTIEDAGDMALRWFKNNAKA